MLGVTHCQVDAVTSELNKSFQLLPMSKVDQS